MSLLLRSPSFGQPERQYVYDVVFKYFLGLEPTTVFEDRDDVLISVVSDSGQRQLTVDDSFFRVFRDAQFEVESLPRTPLERWDISDVLARSEHRGEGPLPVLYGNPVSEGQYCARDDAGIHLGLDIFGSVFFMLTRYEELVLGDRDELGRFSAKTAIAFREGFLDRPLVDEYVELLWAYMKQLWPQLQRKEQRYTFVLSCDVDHPSSNTYGTFSRALRNAAGDLVRRRDMVSAIGRFRTAVRNARGDYSTDPHNTFDLIMTMAERYGLKGAFYFITGHSGGAIDGDYTLDMPWIRQLMHNIHARGHEIGLHPSFNTFLDGEQIRREFSTLLRTCDELGIQQDSWGGRQHYLRWQAPDTWQHWENAGLTYDSTVGFADHVGFRAGTCREFPVFNLRTRSALNLIERPLIVMEGTLLNPRYMNVGAEEALQWIERLASTCRRYNGNFTLLWHNSMLTTPELKRLFRDAVASAV